MIQYTYDEAGNRATMTENGTLTTYEYDANNRMTAEQTGLNVKTFLYDANGNQLSALYNFNFAGAYTYNLFGHQTSYTPDEAGYTYYTYRADGLRHSVGDTVHIWDGTDIVADINGSVSTIYFRGIGLIFSETAGVRTYYHQNAHGDVIMLTDGQGNIIKTYEYDAFGVEWDAVDTDNNPFRYCGEYFDKETKTVYLRARYYDSAYGRFTQQDGWEYANYGDPLSLNLYTYCVNNPVNMVDPSGHLAKWLKKAVDAVKTGVDKAVGFVKDVGERIFYAALESFECEAGVGYGLGGSVGIGPVEVSAEAYQDVITGGLDDGDTYTAISGSAGVSAGLKDNREFSLGISTEYEHRFETGYETYRDEHNTTSLPHDVYNCDHTEKTPLNFYYPFSKSENAGMSGDKGGNSLFIGFSGSFHFIIGGHFSIGFDVKEFVYYLINGSDTYGQK